MASKLNCAILLVFITSCAEIQNSRIEKANLFFEKITSTDEWESTEDGVRTIGYRCTIYDQDFLSYLTSSGIKNLVPDTIIPYVYNKIVVDLHWTNGEVDTLLVNPYLIRYKGENFKHDTTIVNRLYEICGRKNYIPYDKFETNFPEK